jgi:hypothetical protein
MDIRNILWLFGNLEAFWYIFPRFGILCQEKSGNPWRNLSISTHSCDATIEINGEEGVLTRCIISHTLKMDINKNSLAYCERPSGHNMFDLK